MIYKSNTTDRNPKSTISITTRLLSATGILLAGLFSGQVIAQEYDSFSVLGTSQALCKPGIQSGGELQDFFRDNPEMVRQVLQDANWQGNPDDVFAAVAAGEFTQNSYPNGSKFEWTSYQDKGQGKHKPLRVWAGAEPFSGFELDVVSQCQVHRMVIPLACCNLSLTSSSTILTPEPQVSVTAHDTSVSICSDVGEQAVIKYANGTTRTVALDSNGCWNGTVSPGEISVEVTHTDECGVATGGDALLVTGPPPLPIPPPAEPEPEAPGLIPFIGIFAGNEDRPRYEPTWDKFYQDNASIVGIKAGILKPLTESLSLLAQVGYLDRDGVNTNYVYSDDTIFVDVGVEKKLGASGFIGGGVGLWNIADSEYDDASLFVHGGSGIGSTNLQWYVEGRAFADELSDISKNNMVTGGLRYLLK